jgi:Mrp family chromosome partitioning ATPase/capsular polysaccharide biosynthesis protein
MMSTPSGAPRGRHELTSVRDPGAAWFVPEPESEGLPRYLELLRARLWLILLFVTACVAGAFLYLSVADNVYSAHSDLLISPISSDNQTLLGLGLFTQSSDPTRDVETASRLIKTPSVAHRVKLAQNSPESEESLLSHIDVAPVAQSNVVTITAEANDAQSAARLADAFGAAAVADRTQKMHDRLAQIIPRLRSQIQQLPPTQQAGTGAESLVTRLRDLESLRAMDDPTIRLESPAAVPTSAISPRPGLTVVAAILVGLILGSAFALGSQLFDPRIHGDDQLRRYRLPVLARIPGERRSVRKKGGPLTAEQMSLQALDAYRLLAGTLDAENEDENASRTVVVTGPTPGEGKTTTSINLAAALGSMDKDVILVDGDSRRPTVEKALEVDARFGLTSVLAGTVSMKDALVPIDRGRSRFKALLQRKTEAQSWITPAVADRLLRQTEALADWLVFDAPALNHAPDALPFVARVDHVVLVVRLGHTRLHELEEIGELLSQQGVTPDGFVVVGTKAKGGYYYHHARRPKAS